jgi:hypothetical protein
MGVTMIRILIRSTWLLYEGSVLITMRALLK